MNSHASSTQKPLRLALIFCMLCVGYMGVWGKLIFIQYITKAYYLSLGDRQYITTILKYPDRALIYDRNGEPLALNREHISAFLVPSRLEHPEKTYQFLEHYFPLAAERLKTVPGAQFMYIQRKLNAEQLAHIRAENNEDIHLIAEAGRYYPMEHLATTIGITSIDNEGIAGIELLHNQQLKGKPSTYLIKRDARNAEQFYFEKQLTTDGQEGFPLHTTLDSNLSFIAYEELLKTIAEFRATEGSVIIIDSVTGEILTMVTYPTFDPNDTSSLVIEHMKNRIVSETYEFGSVMKVFFTLAALAEGVVTPDTLLDCHNTKQVTLDGMKLSTWKAHGVIPFWQVIAGSNNIGTAQVALMLKDKIYPHYQKCGFGTSYHLLPMEQAGYVTHPSTWSRQSLASLSYGYEVRATLLQLACAWCLIARKGVPVLPSIIKGAHKKPQPHIPLYTEEVIEQVYAILEKTIHSAHKAYIPGYHILGKTGTAKLLLDGAYHPTKNLYTFAGIVSKDAYQRVIVTLIKEAQSNAPHLYASTVTAPLFQRIAERMIIYEHATQ